MRPRASDGYRERRSARERPLPSIRERSGPIVAAKKKIQKKTATKKKGKTLLGQRLKTRPAQR